MLITMYILTTVDMLAIRLQLWHYRGQREEDKVHSNLRVGNQIISTPFMRGTRAMLVVSRTVRYNKEAAVLIRHRHVLTMCYAIVYYFFLSPTTIVLQDCGVYHFVNNR